MTEQISCFESSEKLANVVGSTFDTMDNLRVFLETHPVPQGIIQFLRNLGI